MNKEEIYDAEIAPLMNEIISICQRSKIAMIMSFALPTEQDDSMSCTTALLRGEYDAHNGQIAAYRTIMSGQSEIEQ